MNLLVICIGRFAFYGSQFIPKLNEGAIYLRANLPNSVNLDEAVQLTQEIKEFISKFVELKFILSQMDRPNDGTDPTGFFNIEFHIELKTEGEWKRKIDNNGLITEIKQQLQVYPGINFNFSQPIQDNVEEYVAGVKSLLVIKIFGNDLFELESRAQKVANSIKDIKGIEDSNVYKNSVLPELRIQLHDDKMARYAITTTTTAAQAVIAKTIGGQAASTFYDEEKKFDIRIRFEKEYRDSKEKTEKFLVLTTDGKRIPLKEIATIDFKTGPTFIYREGNSRYIAIGFNIEG
ncbi:Cu/Ag efflux pump CusA [Flavobacterium sp. 7A]|nr:Cu/Ag efflux pump CusA [Flavobacterium sp. 7A]